ncbi:MAG: histidine kinase [Gemmatimonadota bacterium]|jgi:signal transduction histidine kinase
MIAPTRRWLLWWTAVFLGWTAVGMFSIAQGWASALLRGVAPDPRWLVAAPLLSVWLWVLLTPAVWWLGRRFRVERGQVVRSLGVHLVAALAIALLDVRVDLSLLPAVLDLRLPSFWSYFTSDLWLNFISYSVLLAIVHAVEYRRLYDREHETARDLSHRLLQAQMEALRAHLHPHFLFNAINGAAELIHESPDAADRMLTRLGGLLHRAFAGTGEPTVSLAEELGFAEDYLGIAKVRFGDRLDFTVTATDEARRARVPGFLLQPLLENAIRHGIEPSARGGVVRLDARVRDSSLVLTVTDTGAGPSVRSEAFPDGHGLAMVRRLLRQAYGDAQSLVLRPAEGGGTVVEVRLPQDGDGAGRAGRVDEPLAGRAGRSRSSRPSPDGPLRTPSAPPFPARSARRRRIT